MNQLVIREARSDEEILACFSCVKHYPRFQKLAATSSDLESSFLGQVKREQVQAGYRLLCVCESDANGKNHIQSEALETNKSHVKAIIGYRKVEKLHDGKLLVIDDLSSHEKSVLNEYYYRLLLYWIKNEGLKMGANRVAIDIPYNNDAVVKLLLEVGFTMTSHHFTMKF